MPQLHELSEDGRDGEISLDACLIVRDEEKNLPGCLEALLALCPLLGQINVYDTGSTDRTVEIARGMDCNVVEGFWDEDFARARNASLSMSEARWALLVDADERVKADPERLRRALVDASPFDVLNASFSHVDDTDRVIGRSVYEKVVKVSQVAFFGRVHETVLRLDGGPTRSRTLGDEDLHFKHLGYATADIREGKAKRNAAISEIELAAAVKSGHQGRIAEGHYHHARSLRRLGAIDRALASLDAAYRALPGGTIGRDRVVASAVELLLDVGRPEDAAGHVKVHLESGGAIHVVRLLLARIAVHEARPLEALRVLDQIPEGGDPDREVDPRDVLSLRIAALDQLERYDEALACCLILVSKWHATAHVTDLLHRVSGQDADAVAELLGEGGAPTDTFLTELRLAGDFGRDVAARLE